MRTVSAYAATSATEPLTKTTINRRDPGPDDVAIDIKFVGICHSDIHTVKAEWGQPNYPVVPGHEIAGVVTAVGSDVTKHKVGDHVGVGCFVDSCRECSSCQRGIEQYCKPGATFTYNAVGKDGQPTYGGYSEAIVVDENYVLRIPDALPMDAAAPLLCAGITLYSPLRHWNAGPSKRGRGDRPGRAGSHGRQTGHGDGRRCDGTVPVAEENGGRPAPGRQQLLRHRRSRHLPQIARQLRPNPEYRIGELDLGEYLNLLDVDGTLVELGIPEHPMEVPAFPLALMRRSLSGSNIGGVAGTQEMLDFCAEHGVTPEIELIEPDYINEAYERVLASDVRYRLVIDTSKL